MTISATASRELLPRFPNLPCAAQPTVLVALSVNSVPSIVVRYLADAPCTVNTRQSSSASDGSPRSCRSVEPKSS
jgi:hypothetical protein